MLRILLVEDDSDVAAVTAAMLEHLGHHTTVASNGTLGLDIALRERPEVVITDFMMPVMSGLQLIEQLREGKYCSPIVLCSAIAESLLPAHAAQYDVFLRKPYDLRSLMHAIKQAQAKHC